MELHGILVAAQGHTKHLGASVIVVTPQTPDNSLKQVEKDGYAFPILNHLDDRLMTAYRLELDVPPKVSAVYRRDFSLNLAEYDGFGRDVLPVPSTFVIDRQGIIRAAFANTDHKQRMKPAAIIEAYERMKPDR